MLNQEHTIARCWFKIPAGLLAETSGKPLIEVFINAVCLCWIQSFNEDSRLFIQLSGLEGSSCISHY